MWFIIYKTDNGELVSIGTVVASDEELSNKGLSKLIQFDRPEDSFVWDAQKATFVERVIVKTPEEDELGRLLDLRSWSEDDHVSAMKLLLKRLR